MTEPVTADAGRPAWRPAAVGGHGSGDDPVCIVLSAAQVEQVVRAASDGGRMSVLLSGLGDLRAMFAAGRELLEDDRLSRSLLCGLLILASLAEDGKLCGRYGARADARHVPKHRLPLSLDALAVGLVQRDSHARRYMLADAG